MIEIHEDLELKELEQHVRETQLALENKKRQIKLENQYKKHEADLAQLTCYIGKRAPLYIKILKLDNIKGDNPTRPLIYVHFWGLSLDTAYPHARHLHTIRQPVQCQYEEFFELINGTHKQNDPIKNNLIEPNEKRSNYKLLDKLMQDFFSVAKDFCIKQKCKR